MVAVVARSALAVMLLGDCVRHDLKSVEVDKDDGDDGADDLWDVEQHDVDILFVIDNSPSMGEEQAKLAANFDAFIDVLEAPDVRANYRIGITTTDNGNPWCPGYATTPEAGHLVASSCKTRLGDFVFDVDVRDSACNDVCSLDADDLVIQPTRTEFDPDLAPRPWLENIEGVKNIPAGTDMAAAFACLGPQGIKGCGFEAPLESMYLALLRAKAKDEPEYGFLRSGALLAIVIVTDEVDCSYDKDWADIFSLTGNKQFWSDPSAVAPSSALCWNAGVECYGEPGHYETCEPVDLDIDGQLAAPGESVLHSLDRYRDLLAGLESAKRQLDPDSEVILALIGGVAADGSVDYADAIDPEFQDRFGIGPGCTGPLGETAIPPVRIRALVDEFTHGNLHSICAPDYSGALEAIAEEIRGDFIPVCYRQCVADLDPNTAILEPSCTVEADVPGLDPIAVSECLRNDVGGYVVDPESGSLVMPNDEADICFGLRVDTDMSTLDLRDDMSAYCLDHGYNLEFDIAYRVPTTPGTAVGAACVLSDFPQVDCPELGLGG
jgi:hypothetical protein